jgi:hypothetical protein
VSTFLLVSYVDIVEVLSKSSFENDCPSPDSSENPFFNCLGFEPKAIEKRL